MEQLAIVLLLAALGLGCVIFYVFLQFLHLSRLSEERQREILERLVRMEERLRSTSPPNA